MRKALTAAALVAVLGIVAFASPASAAVTITSRSGNVMYTDLGNGYNAVYLAFAVTSDTAEADAWMKLVATGNITNVGSGVHRLRELTSVNPDGTPNYTYGLVGDSTTAQTGFFLVQAAALSGTPQNLTVEVYDGDPGSGGSLLGSQAIGFTVEDTIQANANKVNTVVTLPSVPAVGTIGSVEVTGATGTVNTPMLYFSPVSANDWPADTFEFMHTSIDITGYAHTPYHDTLWIPTADVIKEDHPYDALYYFEIKGPAIANTSPVGYIGSGTQIKHTTFTAGTFRVIICDPFGFDPTSLPNGYTGEPWNTTNSATITITGNTTPYDYTGTALTSNPGGEWQFSTNPSGSVTIGTIGGVNPTTAGTVTLSITVTDPDGCTNTKEYSFVITLSECPTITFAPPAGALAGGTVGLAYGPVDIDVSTSGGTQGPYGPFTFAITSGSLPPGLSMNADGLISGTPTHSGTYNFTVTATDTSPDAIPQGCSNAAAYSITIGCPELVWVTPTSLPDGRVGDPYLSDVFYVDSNATGTVHFTVTGLPAGLSFNQTTHVIEGTPTASGNFTIHAEAVDDAGCSPVTKDFPIFICPDVTITTASPLTPWVAGVPNSIMLAASPAGTYTWGASGLPAWLTLDPDGTLHGTPPAAGGPYIFLVTVTDSNQCGDEKEFSLSVGCPTITITTGSPLPAGTVGTMYSQTLNASGGTGPYAWAVTAGSLPPGLNLSAGGVLSGTPTASGTYNFTATATDSAQCPGSKAFSITISCPTITVLPTSVPNGTNAGEAWGPVTFTADGGTAPHTFQFSGSLPTGLSWDAGTKTISGTPSEAGTFNFRITATDDFGCQGYRDYSFTIVQAVPIPTLGLGGLALLVLLLAGAAVFWLRRR